MYCTCCIYSLVWGRDDSNYRPPSVAVIVAKVLIWSCMHVPSCTKTIIVYMSRILYLLCTCVYERITFGLVCVLIYFFVIPPPPPSHCLPPPSFIQLVPIIIALTVGIPTTQQVEICRWITNVLLTAPRQTPTSPHHHQRETFVVVATLTHRLLLPHTTRKITGLATTITRRPTPTAPPTTMTAVTTPMTRRCLSRRDLV